MAHEFHQLHGFQKDLEVPMNRQNVSNCVISNQINIPNTPYQFTGVIQRDICLNQNFLMDDSNGNQLSLCQRSAAICRWIILNQSTQMTDLRSDCHSAELVVSRLQILSSTSTFSKGKVASWNNAYLL